MIEKADETARNKELEPSTISAVIDSLNKELDVLFVTSLSGGRECCKIVHDLACTIYQAPNKFAPVLSDLARHSAAMQINAVALNEQQAACDVIPARNTTETWRSAALACCFDATKTFFDTFTSATMTEYYNMTLMEWVRLILALKIMSRLCFHVNCDPEWDDAMARKEARFGMIMESILYRMQELTATGKPRQFGRKDEGDQRAKDMSDASKGSMLRPDHFFMFKSVLGILKEVYDERVDTAMADAKTAASRGQHGSICPVQNGSIKDSEYWEALQWSDMMDFGPLDSEFGDLEQPAFQDWDICGSGSTQFDGVNPS